MAKVSLGIGADARDILADLEDFFSGRGVEAYVAGGFLRDALLGRGSHDVDISIAGDPLVLGRELADAHGCHYFPLAEALEHEIDHINGILYIDHLESKDDLIKIEPPSSPEGEPAKPSSEAGSGESG